MVGLDPERPGASKSKKSAPATDSKGRRRATECFKGAINKIIVGGPVGTKSIINPQHFKSCLWCLISVSAPAWDLRYPPQCHPQEISP